MLDGAVKPEGIELVLPPATPGVSIGSPDADIYETPLPAAIIRRDQEDSHLVIAVFPRRKFFHQLLLTRKDSKINDFADFRGKRVFPDFKQAEASYFKETGIFPINHVLVIKKEIVLNHRWAVPSILKAFEEAKRIALDLLEKDNSFISSPWLHPALEEQPAC